MAGIKKNKKSSQRKISLVFDEQKRREFLTGFHKRKLQRKKQAKENFDRELKEERKRIKREAKDAYKKLVVSHRPVPELEKLLSEEYEDDTVTVTVTELSTSDIARKNNWIGPNQPKYSAENMSSESEENDEEVAEIPGMELTTNKKAPKKPEKSPKVTFNSEKEIKRALKKQATKVVKKSKVFKMKYKMDKQKERKKSFQEKKHRLKISSSSNKKEKRKR